MLLRAAYVLPIHIPLIRSGAVRIEGGCITTMGDQLQPLTGETVLELPHHIVLPGLINAHTHLDLSNTAGPLPVPTTYTEWVNAIIALRREFSAEDLASGMTLATAQLLRGGTTTVGDFVGDVRVVPLLAASPLSGRAFVEVIANGPARLRERQAIFALAQLEGAHPAWACSLTPHAIHTVDRLSLQTLLLQHAAQPQTPLAIHCAESREEVDLFTHHAGPLYERMTEFGYQYGPTVESPVQFLQRHGGVPPRSCLIHCNYLRDADIAAIRAAQCTIIHCPQSHRYFGHDPFPLDRVHAAGIPIAIGTDGLPCANALNMLTELRLLREQWPALSAEAIVRMATQQAAEALWLTDRGHLAPGMRADLIAMPLRDPRNPYESVLMNTEVPFVMIGGTIVRNTL